MASGIERNIFADYVFFIPAGQATSTRLSERGSVVTGGIGNPRLCLVGLITPAGFTGTAVGLEVSLDGLTWYGVYNADGTAYGLTVGAGRWTVLAPSVTFGFGHIRIVGGAAQTADCSVIGRFQVV